MSDYQIYNSTLKDIAQAIRYRTSYNDLIPTVNMKNMINNIDYEYYPVGSSIINTLGSDYRKASRFEKISWEEGVATSGYTKDKISINGSPETYTFLKDDCCYLYTENDADIYFSYTTNSDSSFIDTHRNYNLSILDSLSNCVNLQGYRYHNCLINWGQYYFSGDYGDPKVLQYLTNIEYFRIGDNYEVSLLNRPLKAVGYSNTISTSMRNPFCSNNIITIDGASRDSYIIEDNFTIKPNMCLSCFGQGLYNNGNDIKSIIFPPILKNGYYLFYGRINYLECIYGYNNFYLYGQLFSSFPNNLKEITIDNFVIRNYKYFKYPRYYYTFDDCHLLKRLPNFIGENNSPIVIDNGSICQISYSKLNSLEEYPSILSDLILINSNAYTSGYFNSPKATKTFSVKNIYYTGVNKSIMYSGACENIFRYNPDIEPIQLENIFFLNIEKAWGDYSSSFFQFYCNNIHINRKNALFDFNNNSFIFIDIHGHTLNSSSSFSHIYLSSNNVNNQVDSIPINLCVVYNGVNSIYNYKNYYLSQISYFDSQGLKLKGDLYCFLTNCINCFPYFYPNLFGSDKLNIHMMNIPYWGNGISLFYSNGDGKWDNTKQPHFYRYEYYPNGSYKGRADYVASIEGGKIYNSEFPIQIFLHDTLPEWITIPKEDIIWNLI